ncbi:MAG: hypothetical protein ACK44C_13135 [Polaromonas sp.]
MPSPCQRNGGQFLFANANHQAELQAVFAANHTPEGWVGSAWQAFNNLGLNGRRNRRSPGTAQNEKLASYHGQVFEKHLICNERMDSSFRPSARLKLKGATPLAARLKEQRLRSM